MKDIFGNSHSTNESQLLNHSEEELFEAEIEYENPTGLKPQVEVSPPAVQAAAEPEPQAVTETQQSTDQSITPQDIANEIISLSETHSDIHQAVMSEFVWQGKSLLEWMNDCAVQIPDTMTPEQYRQVSALLARKLQKSIYFYTMANMTYTSLSTGSDTARNRIINSLVDSYAKAQGSRRPAKDTLNQMADSKISDVLNHKIAAKMIREFWRDRRDALIEARKLLESIGMSSNIELKYLHGPSIAQGE